jgi:hypothetical protein
LKKKTLYHVAIYTAHGYIRFAFIETLFFLQLQGTQVYNSLNMADISADRHKQIALTMFPACENEVPGSLRWRLRLGKDTVHCNTVPGRKERHTNANIPICGAAAAAREAKRGCINLYSKVRHNRESSG